MSKNFVNISTTHLVYRSVFNAMEDINYLEGKYAFFQLLLHILLATTALASGGFEFEGGREREK